jgi:hypothetical protein
VRQEVDLFVFVGNMQYQDDAPFHYTQDFGISDYTTQLHHLTVNKQYG